MPGTQHPLGHDPEPERPEPDEALRDVIDKVYTEQAAKMQQKVLLERMLADLRRPPMLAQDDLLPLATYKNFDLGRGPSFSVTPTLFAKGLLGTFDKEMPMADIPADPPRQHIGSAARRMAHAALGTTERLAGADPAVPLRVIALFFVAAVTMAAAPVLWAAIGEAVLILLALDVSRHRRA